VIPEGDVEAELIVENEDVEHPVDWLEDLEPVRLDDAHQDEVGADPL